MRLRVVIGWILLLLVATSACNDTDSSVAASVGYEVSFCGDITRVSYEENSKEGIKVSFEEGDIIFISTTDGTWGSSATNLPREFRYNATTKRFENSSATLPMGTYTFIAEYAVEEQSRYFLAASQTHKLEAVQTQSGASYDHLSDNAAMVATITATVGEGKTTPTLQFKQLYSLVCFDICNNSSKAITATSVSATFAGVKANGIFTISDIDQAQITPYNSNGETITINISNGEIAPSSKLRVYGVIAPFERYSGKIDISVTLSDGTIAEFGSTLINYTLPRAGVLRTGNKIAFTDDMLTSTNGATTYRAGWAELPAMIESSNLEYGYHEKLPSNNKLRNYSFCFDKEKHCSIWVAYPLHSCYIGSIERDDDWKYDPLFVDNIYEPNLDDGAYKLPGESSIYDRGHHMPSKDRTATAEDNLTTFYCTNVSPQLAGLNRGKWLSLETAVRNWICSDTLYVVSGLHFESGATYDYTYDAGGNGKSCPVPTHYFKAILRTKKGNSGKSVTKCAASELQCAGFWFKNASGAERETVSVAEIEKRTGLTLFPNVANAPKTLYNASDWQ